MIRNLKYLLAAGAFAGGTFSAGAADPCDYANPGEPLWREISARYSSEDSRTFPYYVFTDGTNISVISQIYVAGFESAGGSPIKLVLPSPDTVLHSGGLTLVSPESFIEINGGYVNKVTKINPAKPGKLNVYVSNLGNLAGEGAMGD